MANGVEDFFATSEHEVFYETLKLLPMQFLDDILRFTFNPSDAQFGNDKLENLAEIKLLDYNLQKSSITIIGKRKAREKLLNEFEEQNPTIYGEKVKISKQETYLGDELGLSVSESASLTIKKRSGLVRKAIY